MPPQAKLTQQKLVFMPKFIYDCARSSSFFVFEEHKISTGGVRPSRVIHILVKVDIKYLYVVNEGTYSLPCISETFRTVNKVIWHMWPFTYTKVIPIALFFLLLLLGHFAVCTSILYMLYISIYLITCVHVKVRRQVRECEKKMPPYDMKTASNLYWHQIDGTTYLD